MPDVDAEPVLEDIRQELDELFAKKKKLQIAYNKTWNATSKKPLTLCKNAWKKRKNAQ